MERRTQLARRFYRRRRVSSPVTGQLADTVLEISAVRRPVRVCCGSRWGRCVLFANILDSLTTPCLVYNTAMYTVYGRCGQYGRCICSYTGRCVVYTDPQIVRSTGHNATTTVTGHFGPKTHRYQDTSAPRHFGTSEWTIAEMGDRGHNRHGPKRGGGAVPLSRSAGNPSNTMWPAPTDNGPIA